MAAPVRKLLGSKSKIRVIALSNNAAAENDMTKPSAIIAGRILPVCPTDAPSRIGSIGSVQGAATVTTPASSASTRFSIGRDPSSSDGPSQWRGEALRTPRHLFVRLRRNGRKNRATRRGASHPGRWRYLGGKPKSAGAGLAVEGDHADLRGTLVAAIDHLLAHQRGAGVAVSAGRYVLAGQRGEGADRAERDDEKAKRRLQHFSRSPSAWLVMICITGEFFRVMSPIVSIVSPGLIFRQKLMPVFCGP